MVRENSGHFLLRIEDIDQTRCTPELEQAIYDDLGWLGLEWDKPVRRQSEHFDEYRTALDRLVEADLAYPAFLSRGETKAIVRAFEAEGRFLAARSRRRAALPRNRSAKAAGGTGRTSGIRQATRPGGSTWKGGPHLAQQAVLARERRRADRGNRSFAGAVGRCGAVALRRPSSYHLSVVLDDALQGITHVVRGMDLFNATAIHRLLQQLLDLPSPAYHHHRLILGADGRKLEKRRQHRPFSASGGRKNAVRYPPACRAPLAPARGAAVAGDIAADDLPDLVFHQSGIHFRTQHEDDTHHVKNTRTTITEARPA